MSPLKAIREKCIDCCGGNVYEVKLCPCSDSCALHPFRMGKNPFRTPRVMSEEQKAAAVARLAAARSKKLVDTETTR